MPFPSDTSLESTNRESCIAFFEELFTSDELKEKIRQFSPENVTSTSKRLQENRKSFYEILGISEISEKRKLAGIFYDLVGPHFLYEVQGAKGPGDVSSTNLRYEIFKKAIDVEWFTLQILSNVISSLPRRNGKGIDHLEEILRIKIPGPWQYEMIKLLPSKFNLPIEIVEAPSSTENKKPEIEIVTAIREYRPLHDYQIFAGKKIQDKLLAPNNIRKRMLISIPTGAGKTRLVAESLIDWLNNEKPSEDPNMRNSKYLIWIAQSRELCEQAISQFQEIYAQKGKSALTVFRFFGNNKITLDTILSQRVDHGLIVCTISKIYRHIKNDEKLSEFDKDYYQNAIDYDEKVNKSKIPQKFYDDFAFGRLRKLTSCVVVDEAHKAIMPTYTCVLRGLGFNFQQRNEQKCNEFGITLVGLTATAFRGTGLERSAKKTLGHPHDSKVKLFFKENGIEKYSEVNYPLNCSECKKSLKEGDVVLQSTSNPKLIWHENEQKLSAETTRIYSRFSEPLVPKIYAFSENKKPKAIITCTEKCVANDPVRISGEKSYDLLGHIIKYSWKIERRSNLTEVFGLEKSEDIELPKPMSLPVVVEELKHPGTYKISLTVENYDGLEDTTTKIIEVIPTQTTGTNDEMKDLIQNLITRDILCNVFHTYIKSERIDVRTEKNKEIDLGGKIREKAAQNHSRNEKLVNTVHYLLTAPKQKRKKILVFACDILHARTIALWLKTRFDISAEYIDSSLHESRNISRIRRFREKSDEQGKVLINTNMLTTGFDVPDVDCVVMGRPVISTVEYTQMIGRGMRGPRMGGTREVWIVDFDDQVQLSESMQNQAITLGWKSMAYDQNNKLVWKPLSEKLDEKGNPLEIDVRAYDSHAEQTVHVHDSWKDENIFSVKCTSCENISEGVLEIASDYGLSDDEKEQLVSFVETGTVPELSVLKVCSECKKINEIYSDMNDDWRKLIVKEKSNPILLEFVNHILKNFSGNVKIDITKILNAEEICKKIIQKDENVSELEQLQKEIFAFTENEKIIIKNKIQDAKNAISKHRLGEFWRDHMILQKSPNSTRELASLCRFLLNANPLENLIERRKIVPNNTKTLDEQLKEKTEYVIFNILGFLPEEDKFKETIGNSLYQYMLKKYTTYHNFQQHIPIASYMLKLQKRNECLDKIIAYYQKYKKSPSAADLALVISDFKNTIFENFENSSPTFFEMISMLTDSLQSAKDLSYDTILEDYKYVRSLNPYAPKTEEILRHSKIGIGHYIRYAGSISNFNNIYELDDEDRIKLENLKRDYFEIKRSLGSIPSESALGKHSAYYEIQEAGFFFTTYREFLEFLNESVVSNKNISQSKPDTQSKNELVSNAKLQVRKNGMQDFFEHLVNEPPLKYEIHFGSVEKFIETIFSDNKQVALLRWNDVKKHSN